MAEHRNRSEGWGHAKNSGHQNEVLVKELLDQDAEYAAAFLSRLGVPGAKLTSTSIGGLHETHVPSVCGTRKTKSKTDLKVFLKNREPFNVSVKKSLGGQVHYVRAGLFIQSFETQFGKPIPNSVQRAINLFWSAAENAVDIIQAYADRSIEKDYSLQLRHKSLNATTLKAYDRVLYEELLLWFIYNAGEIAKLCFSMGAALDPEEWSKFVWYKNMLGENNVDALFAIDDICAAAKKHAKAETYYGSSNGGTTIQLPFGFVQWHHGRLQFHHSHEKIAGMLSN